MTGMKKSTCNEQQREKKDKNKKIRADQHKYTL
jgi:hypothetical protein